MDFTVSTLGEPSVQSPISLSTIKGDKIFNFVSEAEKILLSVSLKAFNEHNGAPASLEKAGPRAHIFFDPTKSTAAIVTCGGLCPGINNVIRSLVMGLHYFYGVQRILGIPYGYEGLIPEYGHGFIDLVPDKVKDIHEFGGTILGSSRGGQNVSDMVDTLENNNIDILFAIGGDGTLKGANAIGEEIKKRGLKISVVGIPKTIDNDIDIIDKSFGFETAFDVASPIVKDAHNEATGAYNGISIVKLMGRDSGFIAASVAISIPVVNFVLIPEMKFDLQGDDGFLNALEARLDLKHHAVIVVAEGAGQDLFDKDQSEVKDASGNIQHSDIGLLLKDKIKDHFDSKDKRVVIKYIDPSYIIRSAPANASDSVFCNRLAYQALHGAMAGKTCFVVGVVNGQFVYLPIPAVTQKRKKIDLEGEFWFAALQSTGQPFVME
ncbi:ATP-dependent 6-phosphofructokinase [Subsaximicrobium wynnwilliamsii]|jgi:6-phosphofructokinase 1|uniref:ATP-dependent 6-phosphofructokinase n=1 Tax=Subsaximicrobium wynnwilliamsii TaxID=291179 RepID=A0A5C6ZGH7_9FLAO|nr:ATP-dependent 6-phosphofructokinase [Subsaximicrobium wynnwilliamsii]TXD83211.1 ATP-dependent 6-phosphofructokinase [Subsaximicrobium wynnwilliamsii]TXD88323.1 ATP-dependent 6-phosphofructokinase [Subsaximicrobium wynnwilliamsii]TXE03044.1 ATP-dependent 6-phosphofructokinase [Subsaximicrobium wynnwilliamsii]